MTIQNRSLSFCLFFSSVLFLTVFASAQTKNSPDNAPKYRNPSLSIEDRVADLLPRMTLEEKVAEISGGGDDKLEIIDPTGTFTTQQARETLGKWYDPDLSFPAKRAAILRNGVQRYLREKTRLGIPSLFMGEGLHGFMEDTSTSFPQALGLASTWDTTLVHQVFTAVGDEAGAAGVGQVFSPVLDIARDPRWGRTEETYGEDPFLASRMGVAAITGLQGDTFNLDHHHVVATAKHFAVHGQPEGGTNTAPGNYSERIIRENFLVPFQAAIQEARAGSVMASYNEIDGIPSHINHWLLDKVLRQEWGFGGYITSDGDGLQMLVETHHVAANKADAARLALAAGVDYDLSDGSVYHTLIDQVKRGIVPESEVDRAAGRVLATKFRLGLFDSPYVDPDYADRTTNSPEHRQLALKAAQKVIVLLKNDKNLLPLDLKKLKTIAVIGPNADGLHLGGYSRGPSHGVSILQGIRDRVGSSAQVVYAEGCKITDAKPDWHGWFANDVKLIDPATQTDSVHAAAELARKADVAIVVVGENESTNREAWSENHLGDRDSLDLLGAQNDLVKAVVETGTPTIVFSDQRTSALHQLRRRPRPGNPRRLVSRTGRRHRRSQRAVRRRESRRQTAHHFPALGRRSAGFLQSQAIRQPHLRLQHPQAALSLWIRPELHNFQLRESPRRAHANWLSAAPPKPSWTSPTPALAKATKSRSSTFIRRSPPSPVRSCS